MRRELVHLLTGAALGLGIAGGINYLGNQSKDPLNETRIEAVDPINDALSATPVPTESIEERLRERYEEGVLAGREMQYNPPQVSGPFFMRKSKTGEATYARVDFDLSGGKTFEEYMHGKSHPADMIIISDLREIKEPEDRFSRLNGKAWQDMLWRGAVPSYVLISSSARQNLQTDPDARELIGQYLQLSSIKFIEIPDEEFHKTDPWRFVKDLEPQKGRYIPSRIEPMPTRETPAWIAGLSNMWEAYTSQYNNNSE